MVVHLVIQSVIVPPLLSFIIAKDGMHHFVLARGVSNDWQSATEADVSRPMP